MHFPICALIFTWLVVLNVAAWQNQKCHKGEQANKRNMKWENKVGKMQWKLAEGVNIICKWWGIFYRFTVMLESFPLWWYRNPSSIKIVSRVSEISSWNKEGVPALANLWENRWEATPKWPRWVLEPLWPISEYHLWKKKKKLQSRHRASTAWQREHISCRVLEKSWTQLKKLKEKQSQINRSPWEAPAQKTSS